MNSRHAVASLSRSGRRASSASRAARRPTKSPGRLRRSCRQLALTSIRSRSRRPTSSSSQVAWSYPLGETVFHPLVVRGTVYGRGRNGALVALDARTGKELWIHDGMQGMTTRGMNYWESKDGKDRRLIFSMNDYLQEIDAATGKSIMTLRHRRRRRSARRARPRSGDDRPHPVGHARPGLREPDHPRLGDRRGLHVAARRSPRLRRRSPASWRGVSTPFRIRASSATRPGRRTRGSTSAAPTPGARSRSTRSAASRTSRPARRPTTSTAPIATAPTCFGDCLLALDARTGKRLWHFQTMHHDLWDYDNNAAPQLTTIKQDGRNVDVVALAGKTGFLYVFDRVTGEADLADRRAAGAARATCPASRSGRRSRSRPARRRSRGRRSRSTTSAPTATSRRGARQQFKEQLAEREESRPVHADQRPKWTVHMPATTAARCSARRRPSRQRAWCTWSARTTRRAATLQAGRGTEPARPGPASPCPDRRFTSANASSCHGAGSRRHGHGADAADRRRPSRRGGHSRRSSRTAAARCRRIRGSGRRDGSADSVPPVAGGRGAAGRCRPVGGRGAGAGMHGASPSSSSGPAARAQARRRRAARGPGAAGARRAPYPEGVPAFEQYSINGEYGTIGNMMKPPYTAITAYDLNKGTISWQIGFGDDPALADAGHHRHRHHADAQQRHRHGQRIAVRHRRRRHDPRVRRGDRQGALDRSPRRRDRCARITIDVRTGRA